MQTLDKQIPTLTANDSPTHGVTPFAELVRTRLPDTRTSVTHKFNINGHEGYMTVGFFEDGRPGELFLKMAKQGSTLAGLLNTVGVLTSLCLQYGVPVDTLAKKFEGTRFEPSGWTPNASIKDATSIVDYIFRWLAQQEAQSRTDSSTSDSSG